MNIARFLTNAEWERWDRFVLRQPQSTISHTSVWFQVLRNTYGVTPRYIVVENVSGQIVAGLPLVEIGSRLRGVRFSCLPCSQACNPLVDSEDGHEVLMRKALQLCTDQRGGTIELKLNDAYPFQVSQESCVDDAYCTFVLSLEPSVSDLEQALHPSCIRRPLRKALRGQLELMVGTSEDDVDSFYKIYTVMRKRKGLLPQPRKFFEQLWHNLHPTGQIEILHATVRGKIVSSLILLEHKDTVAYEYGASLPEFLKFHPSHFLLWHAIQRAKQRGGRRFDFGRCHTSSAGLMEFKQRWGATRQNLSYHVFPARDNGSNIRQDPRLKAAMNWFATNMPSPVCRLAGRLVYKHLI